MKNIYILIKKENRKSELIGAYQTLEDLLSINNIPNDSKHIDTINKALSACGLYFYVKSTTLAYDIYLAPLN
jgi:hypothetical protein